MFAAAKTEDESVLVSVLFSDAFGGSDLSDFRLAAFFGIRATTGRLDPFAFFTTDFVLLLAGFSDAEPLHFVARSSLSFPSECCAGLTQSA